MKKFIIIFLFSILPLSNALAEIIANEVKKRENFGPWTVICKEDTMMGDATCKAFAKFYNNLATIHIQPNNKIANQVVIIIPPMKQGTNVKVRIDKNDIITSEILKRDHYGVIPFSSRNQKMMFDNMKRGENIFIRFTNSNKTADKNKEVTIKISLAEFNNMLNFYTKKVNK